MPELPWIASGEECFVLLAFVHEDRIAFKGQIAGAKRHSDFDFVKGVFLPSSAIQEDFRERLASGFPIQEHCKDRLGADAMRAVWVGQIASDVDLIRPQASQEFIDDGDVFGPNGLFGDGTCSIKWQVEEVQIGLRAADGQCPGSGFVSTDESFDIQDRLGVGLTGGFAFDIGADGVGHLRGLVAIDPEQFVVFANQIRNHTSIVVEHGDVSGGHVGNMHLMLVLDQTDQRSAHADDVIVWVGAKAQGGFGLFTCRVRIDGFHHPTEDLLGNLLGRTLFPQQFMQVIVSEILVGELQERLAGLLAEP